MSLSKKLKKRYSEKEIQHKVMKRFCLNINVGVLLSDLYYKRSCYNMRK